VLGKTTSSASASHTVLSGEITRTVRVMIQLSVVSYQLSVIKLSMNSSHSYV
jgi:hypothetical protein